MIYWDIDIILYFFYPESGGRESERAAKEIPRENNCRVRSCGYQYQPNHLLDESSYYPSIWETRVIDIYGVGKRVKKRHIIDIDIDISIWTY